MDAESKMSDPLDPDFYRCICEYDKARRNNAENFAEVKKAMFEAFTKTKLLVPIRERDGKMQSPALEGFDSVRVTPVFTGLTAFEKIFNKDDWTLRAMDSIDLINVPHGYIVIDAATIAVRMSKQDILNIFRIIKSECVIEEICKNSDFYAPFRYEDEYPAGYGSQRTDQ